MPAVPSPAITKIMVNICGEKCSVQSNIWYILGLCETNLKKDVDISLVQHQNYQLHVAKSINNPDLGIARVVMYTHSGSQKERRS
jgi:hypothetical protein